MEPEPGQITQLLQALRRGNDEALDRLLPLLHKELRGVAARHMRDERVGHTLQPTALVNEAYLRLVGLRHVNWRDRAHFVAVASGIMRRILVDHARRHRAKKRGGGVEKANLDPDEALISDEQADELVALDEALSRLAALDTRQSQVVELRYFGGLTVEETAEALDVSARTVKRSFAVARAWLYDQLTRPSL